MTRRIIAAIAGKLREPQTDLVHFHRGAEGHPAACYDAGCAVPRLSIS